jgi:Domain of unknown function (DUF4148)
MEGRITKRSSVSLQFDTSRSPTLHRHNTAQGTDDMKPFWSKSAVALCVLLLSGVASAASKLTPAECNDYPFKPLNKPVTHAQLMQELRELESVGYDPSARNESSYSLNVQVAEARLRLRYRADCLGENVKVPTTRIESSSDLLAPM